MAFSFSETFRFGSFDRVEPLGSVWFDSWNAAGPEKVPAVLARRPFRVMLPRGTGLPREENALHEPEKLSIRILAAAVILAGSVTSPAPAQAQVVQPSSHQQLARDIFKELIEINTTHSFGSTKAAEALAARLRAAGFSAADVQVLTPPDHPTKDRLMKQLASGG
jgi:hypothetical protein